MKKPILFGLLAIVIIGYFSLNHASRAVAQTQAARTEMNSVEAMLK